MWAKTLNSGQVCIAPDYVLCHEKKMKEFIEACQKKLKDFFGEQDELSPFQGKMINKFHASRMKRVIETSGGKIICGGEVDVEERHVQPTIILEPSKDSELMKEEIFGCVLPVYPFSSIKEVVNFINSKDKPLTIYYFGIPSLHPKSNLSYIKENTSSGHLCANEVLF